MSSDRPNKADPEQIYDLAVVGAGPAGLSAAITARARGASVCLISNSIGDNPLARAQALPNYPGLPEVSGLELLDDMLKQAQSAGADFMFRQVLSVLPLGSADEPLFSLATADGQNFQARSVLLACGIAKGAKAQELPGEQRYLGHGVSYCATCDGMFFRGQKVAVVDLSSEAATEASVLLRMGVEVYFVTKTPAREFANLPQSDLFHFVPGKAVSISGDGQNLSALTLNGERGPQTLELSGVFIFRPTIAPSSLLPGLAQTADGYVQVNADMRTNIAGVYAAGDMTGKPLQVVKAAGQGQVAALAALAALPSPQDGEER
jgi:thioredoxin reductase (NADPH)